MDDCHFFGSVLFEIISNLGYIKNHIKIISFHLGNVMQKKM